MFRFEPCALPDGAADLRRAVRAFCVEALADVPAEIRAQSWMASDAAFSRKLGERGWIAMTWPKAFGGHERSALERYVVLEELLAAGAPVGAHWIADRQSGPLLMRHGSETQKRAILPAIARGECFFCIGMSEPDSGSDLAAVRARAERDGGGWRVNGTKLWSSGAHTAHYMIALLRTSTVGAKHAGLSQFLIDLKATPGLVIRPIRDITGRAHFNEVTFVDARLPADALLGQEGDGWAQVTAELALERSGPERFLSSYRLIAELIAALRAAPSERGEVALGRLAAHLMTLRRLSLSVAGQLERGENPALEAAVVKDLGAVFEQEIPRLVQDLVAEEPALLGGALARTLAMLTMTAPSFSLRGGTREILRGIIARGLGLR